MAETLAASPQWTAYTLAGGVGIFLRNKASGREVFLQEQAAIAFREAINVMDQEEMSGLSRDRVFNILCSEAFDGAA